MNRSPLVRVAVLALCLAASALPSLAQEVRLQGLEGGRLTDADLAQGTSIVVFWAAWSPRCRDIASRVQPLAQRWGGRARVVAVSFQDDRAAVETFVAGKAFGADVFLDPDGLLAKKYDVATLPGLLVLKDGQVVYRGKLPEDPDRVIGAAL
ncbi:MAG TPA: hypothetical protein DD490_17935 [Acidobacteria bacterium]|nr:hypothetical protein [Acidobacteriota bacterium]